MYTRIIQIDRGRVSRSFDEVITIDLVEMTLTIRLQRARRCALAIAKPTPRGY